MTFAQCTWLNEPAVWRLDAGALTVTTHRSTDFWRETYYGFTRDTGHFFGFETAGDFTAEMRIRAQYRELYDQAGLMVRLSDDAWPQGGDRTLRRQADGEQRAHARQIGLGHGGI